MDSPTSLPAVASTKNFECLSVASLRGPENLEKRLQKKYDIIHLQRVLSVSHFVPPPTADANIILSNLDSDIENNAPVYPPISPNVELCMEFCWCFPCCFSQTHCNRVYMCLQWCCSGNNTIYDTIWYIFYAPMFTDEQIKTTNIQKLVMLIRLCFELYKTMIGSFLTVFTPQDCGEAICTLTQNLIPKNDLETVALAMNSLMAVSLLTEYGVELMRERILRTYFENDQRLPVEKEYFTNLLGILDTKKASFEENSQMIGTVFRLYRQLGIVLLSLYIVNVSISGVVIYENYYDKSSLFGFITNALFIVFKMASILKIALHSINMPYSAYIETPVAFNSIKAEYITPEIKKHFLFGLPVPPSENIDYFRENKQYMRFLLDGPKFSGLRSEATDKPSKYGDKPSKYGDKGTDRRLVGKYVPSSNTSHVYLDLDDLPEIRHRKSFG